MSLLPCRRPLSEVEACYLRWAICLPPDSVANTVYGVDVTPELLSMLITAELASPILGPLPPPLCCSMLDDDIINLYGKLCVARAPGCCHVYSTHLDLDAIRVEMAELGDDKSAIGRFMERKYEECKSRGLVYKGGKDTQQLGGLVFPVLYEKNHWIVWGFNPRVKEIYLIDSLAEKNINRALWSIISRFIKLEGFMVNRRAEIGGTPKQTNHYDCGVFVCVAINLLVSFFSQNKRGDATSYTAFELLSPSFTQADIPRLRQQIALDILTGCAANLF